jgi:carboxypeptidase family protein
LLKGMTTMDARQADKPLPLEQENGVQTAVMSGPADFSITLNAGLPLHIEAGRASFMLPAPTASSARLRLVVPGEHTSVSLSSGLITSRASAEGATTVEATLVPGEPVTIWWATREAEVQVVPKEARFLSDVKTLLSVSESELRVAALVDINVVQGEPSEFQVVVPADFEVTGVTGASLESSEVHDGVLTLEVSTAVQRHQFLISLERPVADAKASAPILSVKGAQRETGEVLVEGIGTMELTTTEGGSLKRMDVKETNNYLRALSQYSLQAAFRFHRQPNEQPALALQWTRFPDTSVLAAIAEKATVTTLVTSEGKTLTEVKLTIKNQAQPFLRVTLPAGANILSADVAGEKVKPVEGTDGSRVPLLRTGFRPNGPYEVSFVFMHSGAPFAKKGGSELSLPKMDVPINMLHWELFLPDRYQVKDFGGDVTAASLLPETSREVGGVTGGLLSLTPGDMTSTVTSPEAHFPGQIGGVVVDPSGAVIPGAQVSITNTASRLTMNATTDSNGRWFVSNFPSGSGKIRVDYRGFNTLVENFSYDAHHPAEYMSRLNVGSVSETVEVSAEAVTVPLNGRFDRLEQLGQKTSNVASANVVNLQRRVAGVLPVAIEVPRTGTSFEFARALVLDEETRVTFSYKSR